MDDLLSTDAQGGRDVRCTGFVKRAVVAGVGMSAAGVLLAAERAHVDARHDRRLARRIDAFL